MTKMLSGAEMWVSLISLVWMMGMVHCAPGEPNARCCYDQEYSVILGDVGIGVDGTTGEGVIQDGVVRLSRDYYRNRYGTKITMKQPDGSETDTYELRDYAQRLVYTVMENGTCVITDMPAFEKMHQSCIPEMAIYLGPSTIGYGNHALRVNSWRFPFPVTATETGQFTLTVTQEHCVPVLETLVANVSGLPIEQTLVFMKYHPGIVDTNFLIPPSNCQHVASASSPPFYGHGFFGFL